VAAYLESIKHVGPRGAATLVERFGAGDVLAAIDRDPERVLGAVPGIGPRRLPAAADSWRGQRELRELLLSAPSERGFVARIDRNATPPAGPTRSVGLHSAHGIAPPATA